MKTDAKILFIETSSRIFTDDEIARMEASVLPTYLLPAEHPYKNKPSKSIINQIEEAKYRHETYYGVYATHIYLGDYEHAAVVLALELLKQFPCVSEESASVCGLVIVRVPERSHFAVARNRGMLPAPAKA